MLGGGIRRSRILHTNKTGLAGFLYENPSTHIYDSSFQQHPFLHEVFHNVVVLAIVLLELFYLIRETVFVE